MSARARASILVVAALVGLASGVIAQATDSVALAVVAPPPALVRTRMPWADCIMEWHYVPGSRTTQLDSLTQAPIVLTSSGLAPACPEEAEGYVQPNTNPVECGLQPAELAALASSADSIRVVVCQDGRRYIVYSRDRVAPPMDTPRIGSPS